MKRLVLALVILGLATTAFAQFSVSVPDKIISLWKNYGNTGTGIPLITQAIGPAKACSTTIFYVGDTGGKFAVECSTSHNAGGKLTIGARFGDIDASWAHALLTTTADSTLFKNQTSSTGYIDATAEPAYHPFMGLIFTNPGSDTCWITCPKISVGRD